MSEEESNKNAKRDWPAIVFALCLPSFVTLAYFVWAGESAAGVQQGIYSVAKVIQFGFPVFWVFVVLRHRPRWQRPITRGLTLGTLFGLAVGGAMVGLYFTWLESTSAFQAAGEEIKNKVVGLQMDEPWRFVLLGIFYSLVHAMLEEYYWRWFVFGQLARYCSANVAIAVSALGFAAHHVIVLAAYFGATASITWLFSAAIAVGGAFWAWLYHRSGSLLGPWVGHLLIDAAIFTIGYAIVFW